MTNREICDMLDDIGQALELVSDNPFRAKAYFAASRTIRSYPDSVAEMALAGQLSSIKGVGRSVAESIREIAESGSSSLLNELLEEIPPGVWRMLSVPGLGPKRVRALWRSLNIDTLDELEAACKSDRLLALEGFGERTQASILEGIAMLRRNEGRLLLSAAEQIAEEFTELLHERMSSRGFEESGYRAEVTGELRRQCETVDTIDILVSTPSAEAADVIISIVNELAGTAPPARTAAPTDDAVIAGLTGSALRSAEAVFQGARIVVYVAEQWMAAGSLFALTGSLGHVRECEAVAPQSLSADQEYTSECEIYSSLGMEFVPPELREGTGEVAQARLHRLPRLLERTDIRGVLHVHTNYSDGSNSIEEIVRYCSEQGYEYVGIADHSRSAFYAGGLSESDLMRQHDEILEVQSKYPGIRILHGIESDILAEGQLDYDDDTLAILDFVIGSVHSRFSLPGDKMTARVIAAIKHPYLSILGHPTGRLLLSREPYQIDLEAVLNTLAETGKAVELNADPHRLDLDYVHCRIAKEKGIPVSINPDAHNTTGIENLKYGVAIARKGWLSSDDVLNCRSADGIARLFRAMRHP